MEDFARLAIETDVLSLMTEGGAGSGGMIIAQRWGRRGALS